MFRTSFNIALVVAALLPLAGCNAAQPVQSIGAAYSSTMTPPNIGGVWCLDMPTVTSSYGDQRTAKGAAANLMAMHADGITGCAADVFAKPGLLVPILTAGDSSGITVAPMLDLSVMWQARAAQADLQSAAALAIIGFARAERAHKCAARTPGGSLVVWVYGTHQLPDAGWVAVLQQVLAAKCRVWVIGDESAPCNAWNAAWSFAAGSTSAVTTLMPQYTRPGQKLDLAPDGGARYSLEWDSAIATRAPAVLIVTWNGLGDGSEIAGNVALESITKQSSAQY